MNIENRVPRNDLLKAAFANVAERKYAPYMDAPPHIFSVGFIKTMDSLIYREKQGYRKFVNTVGKRIAVACVVFTVLASSTMTVEAVRIPVVEFVQRIYRECTDFIFFRSASETSAPESVETAYELSVVPDRFVKSYFFADELTVNTVWESENGEMLFLEQNVLDTLLSVDTEGSQCVEVFINGYEGLLYSKPNQVSIVWSSENYSFVLSYNGEQLNSDSVLQMARSLRPAEDS